MPAAKYRLAPAAAREFDGTDTRTDVIVGDDVIATIVSYATETSRTSGGAGMRHAVRTVTRHRIEGRRNALEHTSRKAAAEDAVRMARRVR